MLKTRKIIAKRVKITKKKKIIHRTCGQDHFNAKESSKVTKNKRRLRELSKAFKKIILKQVS
jgi:ribosomal protein L35